MYMFSLIFTTQAVEMSTDTSSQKNLGSCCRIEKLVPSGTDGRLPLSGDFRSLIVE